MDLDTTTMRLLAAIEREHEATADDVVGLNPMTSDGSLCGPPADLDASQL